VRLPSHLATPKRATPERPKRKREKKGWGGGRGYIRLAVLHGREGFVAVAWSVEIGLVGMKKTRWMER
jgi:hypothetical protein